MSQLSSKYNLVWFRSDLRVYDHPALFDAMSQGPTIAIYCVTEAQWQAHDMSPAKRALILRQVKCLESELSKLAVPLLVFAVPDFQAVPKFFQTLHKDWPIRRVFFNIEYELNERRCAEKLTETLAELDIPVSQYHDACLIPPGSIRNKQGEPYKVFSAFKREFVRCFSLHARNILNRPDAQQSLGIASDLSALPKDDQAFSKLWPAGEEEAHDRLNDFLDEQIKAYKAKRDFPAIDATSQLSPYLAIGAISSTQCMRAALSINHGSLTEGHQGVATWISELIWREFYRHLLVDFPHLCRHKPFKPETDQLPWKQDELLFEAWKTGQTGYPLVDAAMRQLNETAWMHNRLRMVVAMFLTKHLFIDWRLGEAYFMSKLVDGDLASNNGGWQWSASTGVDAVPYFRIFNPVRQSERFDRDGEFIRHYVPELADLDNKSIHSPSASQAKQRSYPLPIVDHRLAVAQTKRWFKGLSEDDTEQDLFSEAEQTTA